MESVFEGKSFSTTDKEELRRVLNEYKIDLGKFRSDVKTIDEALNYLESERDDYNYKRYSVELDYKNENISWIGLTMENGWSENGPVTLYKNYNVKRSVIKDVMTFKEASEFWGLDDSTLRKLVNTDKIIEGIDYRKSGNVWIITKEAMKMVYGEINIKGE